MALASMTLLQMAQEFCKRRSLPQPLTVTAAQDDTTLQIWGLLNEGIADISDRFEWQQLRFRSNITKVAVGTLTPGAQTDPSVDLDPTNPGVGNVPLSFVQTAAVPGFRSIINRTFWDNSTRREIWGPFNPKDWEMMLALGISQTMYNYTVAIDHLLIWPPPPPDDGVSAPPYIATVDWSFEYLSSYAIVNFDTGAATQLYTTDSDYALFPSAILLQDLKWRWNYSKGLPYAEDMRIREEMITNLQGRQPAADLILDNPTYRSKLAGPGLYVAAGSWPIP